MSNLEINLISAVLGFSLTVVSSSVYSETATNLAVGCISGAIGAVSGFLILCVLDKYLPNK